MSGIELRQADIGDADAIRDLTFRAYARWQAMLGYPPRPLLADYDEAVRKHRFDLLDLDGQLAALIETTPNGDHFLIVNVAVDPARQGQGLGRRLMAHAETLAIAAGFDDIRLYTNQRFVENIRLYRSLGYEEYAKETFGQATVVHMRKRMSGR